MRKKTLLLLFVLFLGITFVPAPRLSAQEAPSDLSSSPETNFKKAYESYLIKFDEYRQAHKDYLIAKNQYQTYETLAAKTIALERSIAVLQARAEVMISFLAAARIKLADETNVGSSRLNLIYLQLDDEITWFKQHKATLSSAGSLPDLFKVADGFNDHHSTAEFLVYESSLAIFFHKEDELHQRLESEIKKVEEKILEIRLRGNKNTSTIERWLLEAKNRKFRSDEKLEEARSKKVNPLSGSNQKRQSFNQIVILIEESHQYLKETNYNLKEIIAEIKRAD
ncbi:MAG: hypothetical protein JW991_03395 [Candidatus Pacebacteria bacterium]|nr:hypothetical protein [Candidatus Paceibacterota bacterium]